VLPIIGNLLNSLL
uniref:Temporin-1Te n=2 Tax=Rana temporaria TaxID=8407 RepID=TPE_RANTE|nr:RecName: Full=Temporin-1Te; Short=TE; AltName: Full=Temporin-E [Rana temporaria]